MIKRTKMVLMGGVSFLVVACSATPTGVEGQEKSGLSSSSPELAVTIEEITSQFDEASLVGEPKAVSCTLSGGAKTDCLTITLRSAPETYDIGPWCPRNITDGPDVSGIWLENGKVYDVDGEFIQNLATFYKDPEWRLFDPETGKINVTDSKISCAAAARPDVAEEYQNHCVECQLSYLEEDLTQTYVIPIKPVAAETIAPRIDHGGVGIAFSGVRLDAPAPTDAILAAHTLAPFDDCGGHVNLNAGYHIHAATDCLKAVSIDPSHASQLGLAMDGFPIHARFNPDGKEPEDLDECRGHETESLTYHYHVNDPGKNAILTCHTGQTGCALDSSDAVCDASARERRGPPPGNRPPRPEPR